MGCVPTSRVAGSMAVVPPASGMVASSIAPSMNCTVPVAAAGVTVAVTGWDCAYTTVPLVSVTTDVVGTFAMVSVNTGEEEPLYLVSPEYTAVSEWLPTASAVGVTLAVPFATVAVAPRVAPSKNCTVPEASAGNRLAVSVTGCPATAGLGDADSVTVAAGFCGIPATANWY